MKSTYALYAHVHRLRMRTNVRPTEPRYICIYYIINIPWNAVWQLRSPFTMSLRLWVIHHWYTQRIIQYMHSQAAVTQEQKLTHEVHRHHVTTYEGDTMSQAAHKQFAVQLAMITWLKKCSHKTYSVA